MCVCVCVCVCVGVCMYVCVAGQFSGSATFVAGAVLWVLHINIKCVKSIRYVCDTSGASFLGLRLFELGTIYN